jgi:hypothetical protein
MLQLVCTALCVTLFLETSLIKIVSYVSQIIEFYAMLVHIYRRFNFVKLIEYNEPTYALLYNKTLI